MLEMGKSFYSFSRQDYVQVKVQIRICKPWPLSTTGMIPRGFYSVGDRISIYLMSCTLPPSLECVKAS